MMRVGQQVKYKLGKKDEGKRGEIVLATVKFVHSEHVVDLRLEKNDRNVGTTSKSTEGDGEGQWMR